MTVTTLYETLHRAPVKATLTSNSVAPEGARHSPWGREGRKEGRGIGEPLPQEAAVTLPVLTGLLLSSQAKVLKQRHNTHTPKTAFSF